MMRSIVRFAILGGVAAALVLSCAATDVGNPQDGARDAEGGDLDVRVRFEALRRAPDPATLKLADGIRLRAVWIGLSETGLRPQGGCDTGASRVDDETVVVELLAMQDEPVLELADRPIGAYCGFEFALDQVSPSERPDGAPEALVGRSVLVVGERSDGTAFEIRGEFESRIALKRHGTGFRVDADRRNFLTSFATSDWIDAEALDAIRGGSPIVVDRTEHRDVFEPFREALPDSVFFLPDEDANGVSDPSEREEILASTLPEEERRTEEESDDDDAEIEDSR